MTLSRVNPMYRAATRGDIGKDVSISGANSSAFAFKSLPRSSIQSPKETRELAGLNFF